MHPAESNYDLPSWEGGWTVRDLALSFAEGGPSHAQRERILKGFGLRAESPAKQARTA